MAVITPQSDVYLLKVPLEIDNENQLTFANATAQHTYFNSLPKKGYDDFTYIRKDGVLRIPDLVDNLYTYNYVMYRNDAYSNKWFYAYITGMEYVNDNVTDVSIATDTFQTWQFDLTYKKTFIEREHVNDDTFGLHTIPENLEYGSLSCVTRTVINPDGDFKDHNGTSYSYLAGKQCICFLVNAWVPELKPTNWYPSNAGAFTGLAMFAVTDILGAGIVIRAYQEAQTDNEIVSIFMAPIKLFDKGYVEQKTLTVSGVSATVNILTQSDLSTVGLTSLLDSQKTLTMPTKLDFTYTPRNNKLFCYPYNYFYVTNGVGEIQDYHYEDFTTSVSFRMYGALSQGCAIKLVPQHYKQQGTSGTYHNDYAINARKYPICAWASDSYTNWLTQNGINTGVGIATSLASGVAGAIMGNPFSLITAGLSIASSIGNIQQVSRLPDRARGDTSMGDYAEGANETFVVYQQTIRTEYAQVLDSFFDRFGYKVNETKIPNVTGRRNWNYVKTIDCYIEADIPQEDLQQIKDMFNKGITFWHNPSTFCDYSQQNDII